ncbi:hypothetical protein Ga0100230_019645 [Opitutaceae bacterium TAV3]|nr:hypothetical protein Ga0100230_019645 [Opitutaceae bacterium TAV3]
MTGELPSAWPNVESAWPDIWPEDLACENALQTAEFLTTLVHLRRDIFPTETYPHRELEDAWRALLDAMDHNQNGQGGDRADRDKLQLKKYSRYAAERIRDNAAWQLAANIPVPDTATFPVVVFNTMSWRRTGVVYARAVVFGVPCSSDATNFFEKGLRLINDRGETVPYVQLSRHEGLSFTMEIAFHADTLPSAGYRTWYLTEGPNPINDATTATVKLDDEAEHADTPENRLYLTSDRTIQLGPRRPLGHDQYQTRHFRILLDRATGDLSIYRRHVNGNKDGAETLLLDRMSIAGVEERRGNYIFAMPASGRTAPAILDSVEILDNNALWFRLRLRGTVYGMRFTQTLILFSHVPEIHLENEIDWTEPRWVRLQQLFPYAASGNTIRYGVPYGQVTYPDVMSASLGKGGDEIDPADRDKLRLCQHWVDIGDDTTGLTIGCDHRMWEFEKTDTETGASAKLLRAYMLRGVGYCFGAARDTDGKLKNTPRPPPGRYTFRYILRPRATSFADSTNWRCGWELNCPPHSVTLGGTKPQANHAAPLPATDSLFDFTDTTLVTTAFKKAEDGDAVILRAFETAGRATATPPAVNISRHAVSETNILEETGSPLTPVRPYEIKTLAIITTS